MFNDKILYGIAFVFHNIYIYELIITYSLSNINMFFLESQIFYCNYIFYNVCFVYFFLCFRYFNIDNQVIRPPEQQL